MKTTATALALLSFLGTANAAFRLQVPYQPTPDVQIQVEGVNSWMEVYRVTPSELPGAIAKLTQESSTPSAVGVVVPDVLHVTVNSKDVALDEQSFEVSRSGVAITYDEGCRTLPQAKDRVIARFKDKRSGASAMLTLEVLEQYAFEQVESVAQSVELRRIELRAAEDCRAVSESRLLMTGTLSFSENKRKATPVPVLVQAIYIKN